MEAKYKVHCFYVFAILASIIIGLISVEWSKVPGLVDYITFALTLSSLILAVLAIIYSIYTNTSLIGSLSEISSAATKVTDASRELNESNIELRSEVSKLPVRLDDVDKSISITHKAVMEITAAQELATKISSDIDADNQTEGISAARAKAFLENSSVRGLEMIFMASLSNKTNTAFSITEVMEGAVGYSGTFDYLLAYKISSVSMGFLVSNFDAQGRDLFTYVHPEILKNIEEILSRKSIEIAQNSFEKDELTRSELAEKAQEAIGTINELAKYFGHKVAVPAAWT